MIYHLTCFLFTCVKGVNQTRDKFLRTVTIWAHQWKMVFKPDMTKQAIEVIFSCKKHKLIVSGCWQGTSREKLYVELG